MQSLIIDFWVCLEHLNCQLDSNRRTVPRSKDVYVEVLHSAKPGDEKPFTESYLFYKFCLTIASAKGFERRVLAQFSVFEF